MQHKQIIELWPNREAFATAAGQKRNTINKWYERDSIPSSCWKKVIEGARKAKIRLKLIDLLDGVSG